MVERPVGYKGMKQIVLDLPAAMGYGVEKFCRNLRDRECGCLPPIVDFLHFDPLVIFWCFLVIVSSVWRTRSEALIPSRVVKPSSSQALICV